MINLVMLRLSLILEMRNLGGSHGKTSPSMLRQLNWSGAVHKFALTALILTISKPIASYAQGLPDWARSASAQQLSTFYAAQASLKQRLKLSTAMLESISSIVGKNYGSGGFIDLLQDLKDRAELASKLQNDVIKLLSAVQGLPSGQNRDDADQLLRMASENLEAGLLEKAQTELANLSTLRWERSGNDREIWTQAIVAQADVAHIRFGADAAIGVLSSARSGLLMNATKIDAELMLKQIDIYLDEWGRKGTRQPIDRAIVIVDDGLRSISPKLYRTEYGGLQLRAYHVVRGLSAWDQSVISRAIPSLVNCLELLRETDGEDFFRAHIAYAVLQPSYKEYDQAIDHINDLFGFASIKNNTKLMGDLFFTRALIKSEKAKGLKDIDPTKGILLKEVLSDYAGATLFYSKAGQPTFSIQINILVAKQENAFCCLPFPQRMIALSQAVKEIVNASNFWNKAEEPSSWSHVQAIIGSSFQAIAAERYNYAKKIDDFPEMQIALDETRVARQYYLTSLEHITEINYGYSSDRYKATLKEIESNIAVIERRLAGRMSHLSN